MIIKGLILFIIVSIMILLAYNHSIKYNTLIAHIPATYKNDWFKRGYRLGYGDQTAVELLPELINKWGVPNKFNGQAGGSAIWNNIKPFTYVQLKDVQIPHNKPFKHIDFLYTAYAIDIPKELIKNVYQIAENVDYKNGQLIVRCNNFSSNVATTWIIKKYIEASHTLDECIGMNGPLIHELLQDDIKIQELINDL